MISALDPIIRVFLISIFQKGTCLCRIIYVFTFIKQPHSIKTQYGLIWKYFLPFFKNMLTGTSASLICKFLICWTLYYLFLKPSWINVRWLVHSYASYSTFPFWAKKKIQKTKFNIRAWDWPFWVKSKVSPVPISSCQPWPIAVI